MPDQFFAKQLKGETPLSFNTAKQLCSLAERILAHRPWQQLLETDLVFLRRDPADLRVCSVMGALGEVFVVVAYQGMEGYHFFQKFQTTETAPPDDYYGEQRSVFLEYEKSTALTAPDREMLQAVGYPITRGARLPIFRALRPGYHPWYLADSEGAALADVLTAMLFVCERLAAGRPDWWDKAGSYPLLTRAADAQGQPHFTVEQFAPPPIAMPSVTPPAIDPERLERSRSRKRAAGVLQLDHFFMAARIGGANERKSLARVVLAVDGGSGFVYPPEMGGPEEDTGKLLADAVLKMLEAGAPPPREIHVRSDEYCAALEPLAAALGARILVRNSLPALDRARDALLLRMGGGH